MKKKTIIIICSIIVIGGIGLFLWKKLGQHEPEINISVVGEGVIESTVTATGYVQPVDKVDIGTQVSGIIEKIFVDFNSQVKKGELLAELDKSTLAEKVMQAKASLSSAQSDLTYAQQNHDRTKQLFEAKAATQASYEEVVNRLAQAKTSLANSQANLHQAQVNLSYAEIYSPIDGIVLNRAVEQGQTVAASYSTPTLFTIANDLKRMQVEADVDEADIGQVRLGQHVTFTVDSYSEDIFTGTVNEIRLQPVVTSNVVTYVVIIEAPNPEEKLYPGMTANVTIITKSEKGLTAPAEALTFRPTDEMMEKLRISSPSSQQQPTAKSAIDNKEETSSRDSEDATSFGRVWIKNGQNISPKTITMGIGDGINTIIKDGLQAGDTLVLSVNLEKTDDDAAIAAKNPLMPTRRRR